MADAMTSESLDYEAAPAAAREIATELAHNNRNAGDLRIVVRDRENRRVGAASLMAAHSSR